MHEKAAWLMTFGGSGCAIWFGWDVNTIGVVGGLIIAVAGWLLSLYFGRRRDRREQLEHEYHMRKDTYL